MASATSRCSASTSRAASRWCSSPPTTSRATGRPGHRRHPELGRRFGVAEPDISRQGDTIPCSCRASRTRHALDPWARPPSCGSGPVRSRSRRERRRSPRPPPRPCRRRHHHDRRRRRHDEHPTTDSSATDTTETGLRRRLRPRESAAGLQADPTTTVPATTDTTRRRPPPRCRLLHHRRGAARLRRPTSTATASPSGSTTRPTQSVILPEVDPQCDPDPRTPPVLGRPLLAGPTALEG